MERIGAYNQTNDIWWNNNVVEIQEALIEDIFIDNRTGYVTISYGVMGDFNITQMELIVLVVSQDTIIQNQCGEDMSMRELREGMIINAEISSAMTRSMPPQSRAFRITLMEDDCAYVKVGRVLNVDLVNSFLYVGNPNDISSQIRFTITDSTVIRNRRGGRICLCELRPGQMVRVEHASFMTMSIPPQTTAYEVQIL